MFAGTPTTGTDEHERTVKSWGGESNAFTRDDYTLYYDHRIPVERIDQVLVMEADRLRNLSLEPAPVLHERGRLEREEAHTFQPSDGRDEQLEAAVFRVHSYRAGLRDARGHTLAPTLPVEVVRVFYERTYHPRNACVVVVAPIDPSEALDAVERAFESLPAGPWLTPPAPEPWIDEPRTERIPSELPVDRVELCWLVPVLGDPARPALELLASWLDRQRLEDGSDVDASSGGRVDRDLFRLAATGPRALEGLASLIPRLVESPPTEEELAPLKEIAATAYSGLALRARPYFSLAATFGTREVFGLAELMARNEPAFRALGPADLVAAARRFLRPERCVTVIFEGTGAEVAPLPSDPAALSRAARDAADAGDLDRAVAAYEKLLELGPSNMNRVIYLAERGMLQLDRRDFDAAIADFEAALAVIDYPAVRDLLEDAHARKRAALRGEIDPPPAPDAEPPAEGGGHPPSPGAGGGGVRR